MKQPIYFTLLVFFFMACSSTRSSRNPTPESGSGHTRTKEVEFLDEVTFKLVDTTNDKTYGYDKLNPINVGGVSEMEGPTNERRFLNGLAGPDGEQVKYFRNGSCCGFRTPNGIGNLGLLDVYSVYWEGSKDTVKLFLNMYDKGNLKIPVGFRSKYLSQ